MATTDHVNDGNELKRIVDLVVHYALSVWNYRWIAIAVVWLVCLAGWAYVYTLPSTYRASTTVYVDTESVLRPLLRGLAVESNVMNEVGIMTRAIVSRPNLERVAREIDLDIQSRTPGDFERLLTSLESRISISRDRQGVYAISFQDQSRETALTVVKSLLDTFVEDTLGSKTEDSAQAEETLLSQIREYEQRMTEAENRLKEFKQQNVGMMPGERGDYYDQLQTALAERDRVEQQLRVEKQKRGALRRQVAGEEPVFGIMTPVMGSETGGGSPLDSRIAQLEQRLNELAIEYTDKHPEVLRTQSLLDDLRERRSQAMPVEPTEPTTPRASNPLDLNPVYQNMKIQLSNVEVEIARLEATLVEKQGSVDRLRELVDVIPQVEAELTRLNRDYDVVRSRYQQMLERWENLQTSQRVGASTENVKFRVIEPPFAASDAVGPPRPMFVGSVGVLALGAGMGLAVLLSLLRPVFFRSTELEYLGYPVIGSVSQMVTATVERHRKFATAAFVVSVVGVLVATALVAAFAEPGSALLRQWV